MPLPNASNYTLSLKHDNDLIMQTRFVVVKVTRQSQKARNMRFVSVRHQPAVGDAEYRRGTLNIQSCSRSASLRVKFNDQDGAIKVQLLPKIGGEEHPLLKPLLHVQEQATMAYMRAVADIPDAKPPLPFLDRPTPTAAWLLKLKSIPYCELEHGDGFISDRTVAFTPNEHEITRYIINVYRVVYDFKGTPFFWVSLKAARVEPCKRHTDDPSELTSGVLVSMMGYGESDDEEDDSMHAIKKQRVA